MTTGQAASQVWGYILCGQRKPLTSGWKDGVVNQRDEENGTSFEGKIMSSESDVLCWKSWLKVYRGGQKGEEPRGGI